MLVFHFILNEQKKISLLLQCSSMPKLISSMLGSLFFVTYMNDKDTSCDHFHNICYAHNTALSIKRGEKLN